VQCRGTNGRRRQKSVTLLKLNGLHWCRVRVHEPVENVIGSRDECKNHDKQLTFIVRVMLSVLLFI